MKIVHISSSATGGAGTAAYRLHIGLLNIGVDSVFLTLSAPRDFQKVIVAPVYEAPITKRMWNRIGLPLTEYHKRSHFREKHKHLSYEIYSSPKSDYNNLHCHKIIGEADIINLHWVSGFIDYPSFFKNLKCQVVWTLHDMNPFLNGFHYSDDEKHYSIHLETSEKKITQIKKKSLSSQDLTIVAPSKWLLSQSEKSELFKSYPHTLIPYGLQTDIFKEYSLEFCRQVFSLAINKIVFLVVAESLNNYRKGFDLLIDALKSMGQMNFEIITIGHKNVELENFEFVKQLGYVADARLISILYNAADAVILPSREDNLPNVMLESLCCGTPIIGFNIGGLPDCIQDGENGILVEEVSADSLHQGILKFINFPLTKSREIIRSEASTKFNLSVQANKYLSLYKTLINQK